MFSRLLNTNSTLRYECGKVDFIFPEHVSYNTFWYDVWKVRFWAHAFCRACGNSNFAHVSVENNSFHTLCAKFDFADALAKKHALNWPSYTSCKKILFDTRVRKWFYSRVAFSPSLRSGANLHTRINFTLRYVWLKWLVMARHEVSARA